jgi:hypothetical protein
MTRTCRKFIKPTNQVPFFPNYSLFSVSSTIFIVTILLLTTLLVLLILVLVLFLILTLDAKLVRSLQHIRVIARPVDLLISAHPLGVVDAVNIVLNLHDNAAILGNGARKVLIVLEALGRLEGEAAVLAVAGVDLERRLVGVDVDGDAGPVGGELGDGAGGAPVIGVELVAVDEVAVV